MIDSISRKQGVFRAIYCISWLAGILAVMLGLMGCQTNKNAFAELDEANLKPPTFETFKLREGNRVRIIFPGAPTMNSEQQISPDGKITLPEVGEVVAVGMTAAELEKHLIKLFEPHLVINEVRVTNESITYPVYVTGAVIRPGKYQVDRPITALDAVMEAGGFDYTRANTKKVRVIRNNDGVMEHFQINLKKVLDGSAKETFYLQPGDIVRVPERFQWF